MTLSDFLKNHQRKRLLTYNIQIFLQIITWFQILCQNVISNQYVKFYLDGFYIGNKLKSQLELPSKNSIITNNFCYNILVSVLMIRLLIFPNGPKENGLRNLKWQLIFTQIPSPTSFCLLPSFCITCTSGNLNNFSGQDKWIINVEKVYNITQI